MQISATANPGSAYWYGAYQNTMSGNGTWGENNGNPASPVTNWSSNSTGTIDAGQVPGANSDVVFAASNISGAVSTSLETSYTINSLTVNGNASSVTIGGTGSLTINAAGSAGGGQGYSAGTGINILSGAAPLTINTAGEVIAAGNQSWTNASANPFSVSSGIEGSATAGNTTTITISDTSSGNTTLSGTISDSSSTGQLALVVNNTSTGMTTLSGPNSFSGGLTLSAGMLQAGAGGALGSGALTVNGGTLDLFGTAQNVSVLNGASAGATILNSLSSTPATLTVGSGNGNGNYSVQSRTLAGAAISRSSRQEPACRYWAAQTVTRARRMLKTGS